MSPRYPHHRQGGSPYGSNAQGGGPVASDDPYEGITEGSASTEASFPGVRGWLRPWRNRHAGINSSLASAASRQTAITNTIWDNIIPQVYGETRVTGQVAFRRYNSVAHEEIYGIIFSHGQQGNTPDGISLAEFAKESSPDYLKSIVYHPGDGSGLSSMLTGDPDWNADKTALWERMAHIVIKIDKTDPSFSSFPIITALLAGCFFASFGAHAAAAVYTNPIDIVYNINQDGVVWRDNALGYMDIGVGGTWREWQAWCDEVMSDGTARFTFHGEIYDEDPTEAEARVLGNCMAEIVPDEGSVRRIWGEKPPPDITGTCNLVSTSNTITMTGGAALTDLDPDDRGYWEGYWDTYGVRQVNTVADNNTWTIKGTAVSIAAGTRFFRLQNGGKYIKRDDTLDGWHKLGIKGDVSGYEIPDVERVFWNPDDVLGSFYEDAEYSPGTDDIIHKITLSNCNTASQAQRYAEQSVNIAHKHRIRWEKYVARSGASDVQIGDIIVFDDGRATKQVARVQPPRSINYRQGLYELPRLVQFNGSVFSDSVATEPTIDDAGGLYETEVTNLPTSVDQKFVYAGDGENYNVCGDPEDLSDTGEWVPTNLDFVLDGSGDFSSLSPAAASGTNGKVITWSGFATPPSRMLVTFLYRTNAAYVEDSNMTLTLSYYIRDNNPVGPYAQQWQADLTPPNDTDHEWKLFIGMVDVNTSADTDHQLRWNILNYDSPYHDVIDIRRMYWVPWGSNPNLAILERFTWTEHADADETISDYQIWRQMGAMTVPTAWSVPQGNEELEFSIISGAGISGPPSRLQGQYLLKAHGINGAYATIDVDTQSVQTLDVFGDLKSVRDVDETDIGAGKALVVAADGATKEYQNIATLPGTIRTDTGATVTVLATDATILCDATAAAQTVNLVAAATVSGQKFKIKKIDSSAYTVTLDPNGAETIDSDSDLVLYIEGEGVEIQSDGTEYWVTEG